MNQEQLNDLRHSCAHLLAAAVLELFPQAKRTIGPPIENGFYYDFDFGDAKISEADLKIIEKKMAELLPRWKEFTREEVTAQEARDRFKENEYKHELIGEFSGENKKLTIYSCGGFSDLCRGGHSEHPDKELRHFKLLSVAGAYWRGSEKNKMLTRIYGTCFPTKDELQKYLTMLEEAKLRDHRKLGEQLELFTISDQVGKGLILWLPNGAIIKDELEKWAKETERVHGYKHVSTPHITKSGLFYTSGHLPYYKDGMYPPMTLADGEEYFLRPMNCPHHHIVYSARPHSYQELPIRYAEYGSVYRYESSGELFGLMRVRGMTQNDAHIYCTPKQAVEEFTNVMKLHEYYYQALGITKYHLELALRDPKNTEKYHGDDAMWQQAEELMRQAVANTSIPMVEQVGSAAFYGPKIDFIIHSSIGREFSISTNQLDLYMGERFGLKYIDSDGQEKTPMIIHRAPLGSHERFIGFLIEHYAGAFPVWLSPTQVLLAPVSEKFNAGARVLASELEQAGIRIAVDASDESVGKKVRNAAKQKIPYFVVLGERELGGGDWTVRARGQEEQITLKKDEFVSRVQKEINERR